MNPVLQKNTFFVKEHVGMFKAANNYDILDPETKEMLMTCREEKLGIFTKILRFTDYKRMTAFNVEIKTATGEKVISVRRGTSFFTSNVEVLDENDIVVGRLKQKFFSFRNKFSVVDVNDNLVCTLKGSWTSWDFKFEKDNREFAQVSKKWAGIGKELFTTADNYMLKIDDTVPQEHLIRMLLLGAVMCIDMVIKE